MTVSMNLKRHMVSKHRNNPERSPVPGEVLVNLSLSFKSIAHAIERAELSSETRDRENPFTFEELVDHAQEQVYESIAHTGYLHLLSSRNLQEPIQIPSKYPQGDYLLTFDPLVYEPGKTSGSVMGTTFALYEKMPERVTGADLFLQPAQNMVLGGYVIYNSTTLLVYSDGRNVYEFALNSERGEFVLVKENLQIPSELTLYSADESTQPTWTELDRKYLKQVKSRAARTDGSPLCYTGCLVADFHRVLMNGGVLIRPAREKESTHTTGPVPLLHRAAPLAFVCETAGGLVTTGNTPLLAVTPRNLHQTTDLVAGISPIVTQYEHSIRFRESDTELTTNSVRA